MVMELLLVPTSTCTWYIRVSMSGEKDYGADTRCIDQYVPTPVTSRRLQFEGYGYGADTSVLSLPAPWYHFGSSHWFCGRLSRLDL